MVTEKIGQTVVDGNLRWYRSGVGKDGIVFEEVGVGMSPEYIRDYLIKKEGEWELIAGDPTNKSMVIRVMRSVMQLKMAEASKLLKDLPGVIYSGTKVEVDWLKAKLLESDIVVEVRRLK